MLSHDDLLSLGIGRVIRSHSLLEYRLRNVHHFLADYGTDSDVAGGPPGAERLADSCRLRLKKLSPSLTAAGDSALAAARTANVLRNRIVHDLWLLDPRSDADQHVLTELIRKRLRWCKSPVAVVFRSERPYRSKGVFGSANAADNLLRSPAEAKEECLARSTIPVMAVCRASLSPFSSARSIAANRAL